MTIRLSTSLSVGLLIDMDQSPFALTALRSQTIDLIEPESTALDDFSQLSYTEAFDKMLEKLQMNMRSPN